MNKQKALSIFESIEQDWYGEWKIPHHYRHCKKEILLPNGEKGILVIEDEVVDFLCYVKKLIENA